MSGDPRSGLGWWQRRVSWPTVTAIIYAKLGVTDRAAAVAEAFNRGLLTPGLKAT